MIELTCPQCDSDLEIDEGFRGGVCRCFKCGSLLTVPAERDGRTAEQLARPEAPPGAAPPSPGAYRTSSGRTVELSDAQLSQAPTARGRRMGIRIGTMAVVGLLIAAVFAAVIYGFVTLLGNRADVDPASARIEEFGYDPGVNPFTLDKPNFMGIAVRSPVVFMADSSAAMRNHLALVKQAMIAGVASLRPEQKVQVAFWNESGPVVYPDEPTAAGQINKDELVRKLDEVYSGGGVAGSPTFTRALRGEPAQVILVARQMPLEYEIKSILQQIDDADARLDVLLIDSDNAAIKQGAEDSGGTYVELPATQLAAWYEQRGTGDR